MILQLPLQFLCFQVHIPAGWRLEPGLDSKSKSHCDWRSVSQSVSLVSSPIWGSWPDIYYCLTVTVLFLWSAVSDERTGLSFVNTAGPCQAQPFSGPFYCLLFETSLFVASYDSQGDGGGIRPRLHTGNDSTDLFLITTLHGPLGKYILSIVGKVCLQRHCITTEVTRLLCAYSLPWECAYRILPSNERLFWVRYSGFWASWHNKPISLSLSEICDRKVIIKQNN
jgi:hypothetical protein